MRTRMSLLSCVLMVSTLAASRAEGQAAPDSLPGTRPLTGSDDIASRLVEGVDRFLLGKIEASAGKRAASWKRDVSSADRYDASIEPNRKRLAHILGVRDARVAPRAPELVAAIHQEALVGMGEGYEVLAVRWRAFGDVHGEGLLLNPTNGEGLLRNQTTSRKAIFIVAIPDADQTPEQIAGLVAGVPVESQYARRLVESGCVVLVPSLIDRGVGRGRLSHREFLYRTAFEMGRHLIGYEVQKVLAAVDWFAKEAGQGDVKIGVIGWGEGGLLAFAAAALDRRIDAACVSGYFNDRDEVWKEPLYRNVFGLLEQFGDAEMASLIAPRALIVEAAKGPEVVVPPGTGGGPGRLVTPELAVVRAEVERARTLVEGLDPAPRIELVVSGDGRGPFGTEPALRALLEATAPGASLAPSGRPPKDLRATADPEARHERQRHEIDRHTQALLAESPYVRQAFMAKLDTRSIAKYEESARWYRDYFADEVIGRFEDAPLPPNVRTRKAFDEPKYTGYEVVMDVFADVIASGILLLPKDVKPGERRPVVVCQHGLEGRPSDLADPKVDNKSYNQYAIRLAEHGFITFAPQNPYIFKDRFRTLQRKANPLKKTLFSVIVPQHRQIVGWLQSLPSVDPARIGFYGLSYGGKSAMRIPPLVEGYCLSICSADFNEWVWKNASTRSPYSYADKGEYEIFEFDLGHTFNYAEMAALIAPRPFMVERGHFDGVAPDEMVGHEFAKVRFLYHGKLGISDRCAIEWFAGPHTIHGVGTFDFLHKHLNWPKR